MLSCSSLPTVFSRLIILPGAALAALAAGGQDGAVRIQDRHLIDRQPGHGGGNQMPNGLAPRRNRRQTSVRTITEAEGVLAAAAKRGGVGQHDMHAGGLHPLHHLDGARDLAFERPHPGNLLHEGGEAHGAQLVEQLVAGVGAAGQALLGQQHARLRGLPVAHQHGRALRIDVEGDAGLPERRADAADVLGDETGVERLRAAGRLR